MDPGEYFKRTRAVVDPAVFSGLWVLLVGCGSGGSKVAKAMARLGVAQTLVDLDDETLEVHNLVRHELGSDAVGRIKHEALREHLKLAAPFASVRSVGLDVLGEPEALKRLMANHALVVCALDTEAGRQAVNACAAALGIPAVYACVFDGGVGGEVVIARPGEACYACISAALNRSQRFDTARDETFDYTSDPEHFATTPCLDMEITMIAMSEARAALLTLLASHNLQDRANIHDVFAGYNYFPYFFAPMPGFEFSKVFEGCRLESMAFYRHVFGRNPDCKVCGTKDSARDYDAEAERIMAEAAAGGGKA